MQGRRRSFLHREAKDKCLDERCSCRIKRREEVASYSGKQQQEEDDDDDDQSSCYYKSVELACSACLFCVCCPLSIAWCCIRLPCKAAGGCCRRGLQKRTSYAASYSSFSDIDSDDLRSLKEVKEDRMSFDSSTKWKYKIARSLQRSKWSARS